MKSLKLFSGKGLRKASGSFKTGHKIIFTATILFMMVFARQSAYAMHEDFINHNYARPGWVGLSAVAGVYFISELDGGPIFFGSMYGLGALYLMNERYSLQEDVTQLVVPLTTLTLSVLNFWLLSDDDKYSKHDVFLYNTIGVGSIVGYAIWEHSTGHAHYARADSSYASSRWSVYPFFRRNQGGEQRLGANFEVFF